jgi:hypothetical protein
MQVIVVGRAIKMAINAISCSSVLLPEFIHIHTMPIHATLTPNNRCGESLHII